MNDSENIWLCGDNDPFPSPIPGNPTTGSIVVDEVRQEIIDELKYQIKELELGNTEIFNANIVSLAAGSNDPDVSIMRMTHEGGVVRHIQEEFEYSDHALNFCEALSTSGLFDCHTFEDSTTYTVGTLEMEHAVFNKIYRSDSE